MKKLTIGLIGNPNSGKTTLFNQLTGARQRVGNWAGVTVERKEGQFSTTDHQVTLVDLPGTYSLTTISSQTSLDEQIACHYILSGDADLLINVVDASNLERNLYLTLQLLELGIPCIVALNMLDIAEKQNIRIEIDALSARLGCPVIPLVSTRGRGIEALKLAIDRYKANENVELVHYAQPLLNEADSLAKVMPSDIPLKQRRWLGLQMLEGDIYSRAYAGEASQHLDAALARLRNEMDDPALHIADARYQCIAAICDVVSNTLTAEPSRFTTAVDKIVLNRFLGLPIFLFVMYLMFLLAINIGGALQPLFDVGSVALFVHGIQWIGYTLHFPDWLTIFLAQGLGGGINTVLPLVPQIGMMYLFLSFLEDSGYMARAAFVMDRLMQALGLPGKSFVPLIVGFGCNVPSVMGARTLDAPRERLMTIMMAPFMSCGARLAIFAVFAAAFFGQNGALAVFSLYMLDEQDNKRYYAGRESGTPFGDWTGARENAVRFKSGADGMVAGQVLDTLHAPKTEAEVTEVHRLKTGAMIAGACRLGVAAAGGTKEQEEAAASYADNFGFAFQLRDDMLDVIGDEKTFGKPIGSDREEGKTTFVDILGLNGCQRVIEAHSESAVEALGDMADTDFLIHLVRVLEKREQ